MPIYTITASRRLDQGTKDRLATGITKIHCEVCNADAKYVNIRFFKVDAGDAYTAGKVNSDFLNFEGVIRSGRTKETEEELLWKMNALLVDTLKPETYFVAITTFNRCKWCLRHLLSLY